MITSVIVMIWIVASVILKMTKTKTKFNEAIIAPIRDTRQEILTIWLLMAQALGGVIFYQNFQRNKKLLV
jgi:hypothetical protein